MATWQYKVIEIVAVRIVEPGEEGPDSVQVWTMFRAGPQPSDAIELMDIQGWRVKGLPAVWDSLEQLLGDYGQHGWELLNVVPVTVGGERGRPTYRFQAFFKAPA